MEKAQYIAEAHADVKAAERMGKLFDELLSANPAQQPISWKPAPHSPHLLVHSRAARRERFSRSACRADSRVMLRGSTPSRSKPFTAIGMYKNFSGRRRSRTA